MNAETSHGSWKYKNRNAIGKRPLKVLLQEGRKSVIKHTKNEPVVGRNIFQRADDPGRHGRFAAIDGWVYTRPCRTKRKTFYFVYLKSAIFVPDTEKCPFLWLLLLRYLLMIY